MALVLKLALLEGLESVKFVNSSSQTVESSGLVILLRASTSTCAASNSFVTLWTLLVNHGWCPFDTVALSVE